MSIRSGRAMAALSLLAVLVLAAPAGARTHPKHKQPKRAVAVRSLGNPPVLAKRTFTLKVRTKAKALTLYAGHRRRHVKADVRLAKAARVRKGKVKISFGKLKAGTWYVIACSHGRKPRCAASKHPTAFVPRASRTPLHVSPGHAAGAATAATIGSAGGVAQVSGPNGARFAVRLPKDSLPDGSTVTLTPLSGVSPPKGFGRFLAGVAIATTGGTPLYGATLTIFPSGHPSHVRALHFSTGADGVHIPVLPLTHHGYGVHLGRLESVALFAAPKAKTVARSVRSGPVAHAAGTNIGEPYEDELADLMDSLIDSGSYPYDGSGAAKAFEAAAVNILSDWHMAIVSTEYEAAKNDDTAGQNMIDDLKEWDAAGEAAIGDGHISDAWQGADGEGHVTDSWSGMSQDFGSALTHHNWEEEQVFAYVRPILRGMYDRAQKKCAEQHDLSQIDRIRQFFFDLHNLGVDDIPEDDVVKCARIKVDFDSTITISSTEGSGAFHLEYTAHPTAQATAASAGAITGSGTGTETATGSQSSGSTTVTAMGATGSTVNVKGFSLPHRVGTPTNPQPATLTIDVGSPTEHYHATDTGFTTDFDAQDWLLGFRAIHSAAASGPTTFTLSLDPGSGAVLARKTFSGADPDDGAAEQTTITVTHTPPPA